MTDTITTPRAIVTNEILRRLRVAWPPRAENPTLHRIGDNEAPDDTHAPYGAMYDIDGGEWRPQADGTFEATFVYQVDAWGERRDQTVELGSRLVAVVFEMRGETFDGVRISLVEPDVSPLAPDRPGRLWHVPDRLRVQVVPNG